MCGIAGFVDVLSTLSERHLPLMGQAIAHRGPDAQGIWYEAPVGLVHRRLSILDLSPAANQPMQSADERYMMVFNGEIYNYRQIAADLGMKGLKTSGDSEVILEAFRQKGPDFVHLLNGMFAIAIYDRQLQELHLFRDRVGIKPLFLFPFDQSLAFASEIKGLLCLEKLRSHCEISPSAVSAFLHLSYIPAELSIYQNIKKLLPGHRAVFRQGKLTIERYWHIESTLESGKRVPAESEVVDHLHQLLRESVSRQMISDVPLGTFLSGGIDSSLVTALAADASPHRVKTFSIGFRESKFDESSYAKKVAEHLKTDHTQFVLTQQEAQSRFDDILDSYDEPFGDSSAIPTMLVSQLAREEVTVILSGDGGDETHLGYGSYQWAQRLEKPLWKLFRRPIAAGFERMTDRYKRVADLLDYDEPEHLPSHIFSQEQYAFSRREIMQLVQDEYQAPFDLPEYPLRPELRLNASERQALFDFKTYLPDDLLVKVDRASMRYSLEVRVPLLDHHLVEYAFQLPGIMRSDAQVSKRLLKKVLFQYVPPAFFDRPKWGFGVPVGDWLSQEWKGYITKYLSEERIREAGLVNFPVVEKLLHQFARGHKHLYVRIWLLILLHKWYFEKHLGHAR